MTNAWLASKMMEATHLVSSSSPLVGEEGACAAQPRGKVRGAARSVNERARALRRNATDAERKLWAGLRGALPIAKFRRQVPLGPYFADFCSHSHRLLIEVDGSQHAGGLAYDAARTAFIKGEGYRVVRFWNNDVLENIDGVLSTIAANLSAPLKGEVGVKREIRG